MMTSSLLLSCPLLRTDSLSLFLSFFPSLNELVSQSFDVGAGDKTSHWEDGGTEKNVWRYGLTWLTSLPPSSCWCGHAHVLMVAFTLSKCCNSLLCSMIMMPIYRRDTRCIHKRECELAIFMLYIFTFLHVCTWFL